MVRILDTLLDLLNSGFGRPSPRHGLNLLYWFANQCVEVNNWNQITVLYNPRDRVYGFRLYHNDEGLLPVTNQHYFEVGNLNHDEARNLPDYVRREYYGYQYNNNADRIIICVNRFSVDRVDSVYVTSHGGLRNFNPNQTFQISPQLLRTIRRMTREDFIRQTTPILRQSTAPFIAVPQSARVTSTWQYHQPSQNSAEECCKCFCGILFFMIMLFCVIVYILGNLPKHR